MPTKLAGIVLTVSLFCLAATPGVAADSKAAPLPTQGGKVLDLAGSRLYYEECGSGSSIVLLHDGLLHGVTWDGVWDALCAKYHVVRYDRRGYGRSDPPTAPFSPTGDLFQLMSRLSLPHALVVGSSSGGALAVDFALEHPGMVDGLFLIGPVLHGMQDSAYFVARGDRNNEPMKRGDVKATAENWSKDRFLIAGESPQARKALYDALVGNPQNLKYSNRLEIPPPRPAASRLAEIQAPALILAGEADIADVHAYCGAINAGIRESARVVVKDTGHFIQLEKPEEIVARLERFAGRAARTRASLPADILQSYAGRYKLGDTILTMTLEGNHLLGRVPGAGEFFFYPESRTRFFARLQDADIEFAKDADGKVVQAVIYQAGATLQASRLPPG